MMGACFAYSGVSAVGIRPGFGTFLYPFYNGFVFHLYGMKIAAGSLVVLIFIKDVSFKSNPGLIY